jgi:hypothetical protein
MSKTLGVRRHESLVRADTGVVVDVSGLGEADDGVDEDVGAVLAGGTDGELAVSAVHGVTGLEGDNLAPCDLLEVGAELGGGEAVGDVVVVRGSLDGLDLTTDVELAGLVVEVRDSGVGNVVGAKDLLGLELLVGAVDVINGEDGKSSVVTEVTESNADTGLEAKALNVLGRDVEGDGHGEESALGLAGLLLEAEGVDNRGVVGLVHEALERRETTVEDELEVTQLALGR